MRNEKKQTKDVIFLGKSTKTLRAAVRRGLKRLGLTEVSTKDSPSVGFVDKEHPAFSVLFRGHPAGAVIEVTPYHPAITGVVLGAITDYS